MTEQAQTSDSRPPDSMPVFLCYRRVDGHAAARWLFERLHGRALGEGGPLLDVYIDSHMAPVSDWQALHQQQLERARVLVFVSSPAAHSRLDEEDWVHRELEWWLAHRSTAPIIVNTTAEQDRYLPKSLRNQWPRIQWLTLDLDAMTTMEAAERADFEAQLLARLIEGITTSGNARRFAELEERNKLLAESGRKSRQVARLWGLLAACVAVAAIAVYGFLSKSNALAVERERQATASAERALKEAQGDLDLLAKSIGLLYMASPEYQALTLQAYRAASTAMQTALSDPSLSAFGSASGTAPLPPAVVLDVDDSVLSNVAFQAGQVLRDEPFDPRAWRAWVEQANAPAVPGAVEFAAKANALHVRVFYVTNRNPEMVMATRRNLQQLGLPVQDSDGVDAVWCREPGAGSSHFAKLEAIARSHRILVVVGDLLNNFPLAATPDDHAIARMIHTQWNPQWIILPQTMYGAWAVGLSESPIDTRTDARAIRRRLESFGIR